MTKTKQSKEIRRHPERPKSACIDQLTPDEFRERIRLICGLPPVGYYVKREGK
jgi:hypothetical protein